MEYVNAQAVLEQEKTALLRNIFEKSEQGEYTTQAGNYDFLSPLDFFWGNAVSTRFWGRLSRRRAHVLDVGCGFGGGLKSVIASLGKDGVLAAVDIVPFVVEEARKHLLSLRRDVDFDLIVRGDDIRQSTHKSERAKKKVYLLQKEDLIMKCPDNFFSFVISRETYRYFIDHFRVISTLIKKVRCPTQKYPYGIYMDSAYSFNDVMMVLDQKTKVPQELIESIKANPPLDSTYSPDKKEFMTAFSQVVGEYLEPNKDYKLLTLDKALKHFYKGLNVDVGRIKDVRYMRIHKMKNFDVGQKLPKFSFLITVPSKISKTNLLKPFNFYTLPTAEFKKLPDTVDSEINKYYEQ